MDSKQKRKAAGEIQGTSKKRQNIRNWDKEEERQMAEYFSEHPYLGKNQVIIESKPSLP
jgi:hypothetical protein